MFFPQEAVNVQFPRGKVFINVALVPGGGIIVQPVEKTPQSVENTNKINNKYHLQCQQHVITPKRQSKTTFDKTIKVLSQFKLWSFR